MSNVLNYFVGQAPFRPVPIELRGSDGVKLDCRGYNVAEAVLLGSDNEKIDLSNAEFVATNLAAGEFTLRWPVPTVFVKSGVYRLQVRLSTDDGRNDLSTIAEVRVRDPRGGK